MLEKRLKYLSIFYVENYIKKPLPYDKAIKEYAAKRCRKNGIIEVCQAVVNKTIILFFWILWICGIYQLFYICNLLWFLILNKHSLSHLTVYS